jgi:hypothetical protein
MPGQQLQEQHFHLREYWRALQRQILGQQQAEQSSHLMKSWLAPRQ